MALIKGTVDGDLLEGSAFADDIQGYAGNDYEWGFDGNDLLKGGDGNDDLYGGRDNDTLYGGDGDDDMSGELGDDLMYGGLGADLLWGGDGIDFVYGGAGDDRISDSTGGDHLDAGGGHDTLVLSYGTFIGGGRGALEFAFDSSGAELITPDGSTAVGFEHISILGSDYNDTLTGGARGDMVRGWQGDDLLHGGLGSDFLVGDNGNDVCYGDEGRDTLSGSGGSDSLYGGKGDDTLIGGGVADVVIGDDLMDGGAGADHFRAGKGRTDISFADAASSIQINLIEGIGLGGDAAGDIYEGGEDKFIGRIIGGAFSDLIIGGEEQLGGDGDDRLFTSLKTLAMTGGSGADTFTLDYAGGYQFEHPLITDFSQAEGDNLDLSTIDASAEPGDQAFHFLGTGAFDHQAGGVRYRVHDGQTIVQLSTDKDNGVELSFTLDGVYVLTEADFLL